MSTMEDITVEMALSVMEDLAEEYV